MFGVGYSIIFKFFRRHSTRPTSPATLIVRLTSDINSLKSLLISSVQNVVTYIVTFVGIVAIMLWMDWRLTLVALLPVPFLYVLSSRFSGKVEAVSRTKRAKESEVASIVHETMTSMPVIRAFTQEKHEKKRFKGQSDASLAADLRKTKLAGAYGRTVNVVMAIGTSLVIWYGVKRVIDGGLSPGALIVFLAYLKDLYKPAAGVADLIMEFAASLVCGERISEVLEMEIAGPRHSRLHRGAALSRQGSFRKCHIRLFSGQARALQRVILGRGRDDGGFDRFQRHGQDNACEPVVAVLRAFGGKNLDRR